jgi:hypothetical protein
LFLYFYQSWDFIYIYVIYQQSPESINLSKKAPFGHRQASLYGIIKTNFDEIMSPFASDLPIEFSSSSERNPP